jgi:hypothetical protein
MSARFLLSPILGLLVAGTSHAQATATTPGAEIKYPGTCEASAAVMLEPGLILVGDDDQEDLRIYKKDAPVEPEIVKISELAGLKKKADLEGAARIGDTIYWIGSHSRKNKGGEDLDRHRLFAIKIKAGGNHAVEEVGRSYVTLIEDLAKDGHYAPFHLMDAAKLAPVKPGGLNIEGLAASPEGELLIGFRNPIPQSKALIATLKNPQEVLSGKKPKFGTPTQLDLGGLGIRSLEYWPAGKAYVISAGSFEDGGTFQAFRWSGKATDKPKPIANLDFGSLIPEAIFFDPAVPNELVVLSDDGDVCPTPPAFRSRRFTLSVE